jgi:hypothetical protein
VQFPFKLRGFLFLSEEIAKPGLLARGLEFRINE